MVREAVDHDDERPFAGNGIVNAHAVAVGVEVFDHLGDIGDCWDGNQREGKCGQVLHGVRSWGTGRQGQVVTGVRSKANRDEAVCHGSRARHSGVHGLPLRTVAGIPVSATVKMHLTRRATSGWPLEESRTYQASVQAAWAGEVYGEALFSELARLVPDTALEPRWKLLAELEQVTGRQLAPLVHRYGFDTDPPVEQMERGVANAREFAQMPHADFMALIEPYLEEVVSRYEALRDAAPAGDKAAMQFLVDHEVALLRFVQLERRGADQDSTRDARLLIERVRNDP